MKKQVLAGALAASIAAVSIAGASLAYFTDEEMKSNEFTVGGVTIDLKEPAWDANDNGVIEEGEGGMEAKDWYPNEVLYKDPQVTNTSDANPVVVRIKVDNLEGQPIDLEHKVDGVLGYANGYNAEDWTLIDGYYYYNYALEKDETTKPLFDGMRLKATVENADEVVGDSIDVYAEAIQAQGILPGSYKTHFGEDWNQKISVEDLNAIAAVMNAEF